MMAMEIVKAMAVIREVGGGNRDGDVEAGNSG